MSLHRRLVMASVIAMVFSLSACGGAGGPEIATVVPPPLPPPPPPRPPQVTVTAPAAASAPAVPAFPQAVVGGPTIAAPGSTLLPMLQTVQVSVLSASTVGPDTSTMDAGATLILDPDAAQATLNIANGALGVSNAALIREEGTVLFEASGSTVIRLDYSALDWTAFGWWDVYPGGVNPVATEHHSQFVTGFQTPGNAVPTSGSATYIGDTFGTVSGEPLHGTASLQADFGNHTITGTLTDMIVGDPWWSGAFPWNSVSLSASFAAGQSGFSGTTAVTSSPGTYAALMANATGTIVGSFFGPSAQEIGAVWTLFDGTNAATGTIGATRGP